MTELLVSTKKGLFVLLGEPGGQWEIVARAFAGEPIDYAVRDPRSGRVLATMTSPFYGPKLFYTERPARGVEWRQPLRGLEAGRGCGAADRRRAGA